MTELEQAQRALYDESHRIAKLSTDPAAIAFCLRMAEFAFNHSPAKSNETGPFDGGSHE